MKLEFGRIFRLGLIATAASVVATFALGFLKLVPQNLFVSIPLANPITPTAASKFFDILKGTFHFDGLGFLVLFISAMILVFLGMLVYNLLGMKAKGNFGEIFAMLMLGTAVMYVLVVGLVMAAWSTILGVLIYGAIISLLTAWVDGLLPK